MSNKYTWAVITLHISHEEPSSIYIYDTCIEVYTKSVSLLEKRVLSDFAMENCFMLCLCGSFEEFQTPRKQQTTIYIQHLERDNKKKSWAIKYYRQGKKVKPQ